MGWKFLILITSRACFFLQNLLSPQPEDKNKKGVLLAMLVIMFILSTVALNIAIFSPPERGPRVTGERWWKIKIQISTKICLDSKYLICLIPHSNLLRSMVAGYQVPLHHDYDDDNLHLVADHELVVDDTKTGLTVLDVRTGVKTVLLTRSIMVGHVLGLLCIVYCLLCYIYSVLFTLYHVLCTVYCIMYCVLSIM